MEAPAPIVFAACFVLGNNKNAITMLVFLGLWEAHYIHRAFIYPLSVRGRAKRMPLLVVSFALLFNAVNGYISGRYLFTLAGGYTNEWIRDPRFIVGLVLFVVGFIINRSQSNTLCKVTSRVVPRTIPGLSN